MKLFRIVNQTMLYSFKTSSVSQQMQAPMLPSDYAEVAPSIEALRSPRSPNKGRSATAHRPEFAPFSRQNQQPRQTQTENENGMQEG